MSPLIASAPLSVRNLLLALGELDHATPSSPLPAFATDEKEADSFKETVGSMLGRMRAEKTPASVRAKLLDALVYALGRDGLPHEFAKMAVASLRDADPAAAGALRNCIQNGFTHMASALERATPQRAAHAASAKRVGAVPADSAFGHLGWSRIGTSSYWRRGDHIGIAKPGVCPNLLSRFATKSTITGLKVTDRDIYFRSSRTSNRDSGLTTTGLGQGTSHLNGIYNNAVQAHLEAHFSALDATASLEASGFIEVAPGAFELSVTDEFDRYELLVLMNGAAIADVYLGRLPNAHPLLRGGDYRLIEVGGHRHRDGELTVRAENVSLGLRFSYSDGFFQDVAFQRSLDTYTRADLGIAAPYLPHAEGASFIVGGTNSSATIRASKTFNGHPVHAIEEIMRPGRVDTVHSKDGFLQPEETLRGEMVFANDFVVGRGNTHQEVATHLRYLQAAYRLGAKEVDYHGVRYELHGHPAMGGPQDSPFLDGSGGGGGFYLSAANAPGRKVLVSPTAIDTIERWGFYEGRGCEWHVSPQILFDILAPAFAADRARTASLAGRNLVSA